MSVYFVREEETVTMTGRGHVRGGRCLLWDKFVNRKEKDLETKKRKEDRGGKEPETCTISGRVGF